MDWLCRRRPPWWLHEALEQTRDKTPVELPIEERVLARLEEDFAQRPEQSIVAMPAALLDRAAIPTQGIEVDLDAEIERGVAL